MTKEEKDLLLKDICARLPYKVKAKCSDIDSVDNLALTKKDLECIIIDSIDTVSSEIAFSTKNDFGITKIDSILPYLRPMSSMTEEELKEFTGFASISQHRFFIGDSYFWYNTYEEEDWLLTHHFDYRRLIEKGLALEAPEDMYKTE